MLCEAGEGGNTQVNVPRVLEQFYKVDVKTWEKYIYTCPVNDAACVESHISVPPTGVSIGRVIAHLNDTHRWTFEEIGKWLESKGF